MMMVTQRLLVAGASSAARRTRAVCAASASSSPSSSYAAAIAAATPDRAAAGADEAWPVVIVGGGPTGALLAGLLARMAVPALLLEKGASPARAGGGPTGGGGHPAAHFITARSMEALRGLPAADGTGRSVAAVVAAASPPLPQWRRFVYGPGAAARSPPWAVVDHFAASAPDPATPTPPVHPGVSPEPVAHLAQPRLVAALHAAAAAAATESGSGGELRYGAEVRADGLAALPPACGHATGPGALVTYHDTRSGRPTRVAARFVVAADGARSGLRSGSGVVMDGPAGVSHLVSIHFTSRAAGKALLAGGKGGRGPGAVGSPPAMLYFFFTPAAAGALVAHDLAAGEFVAQVPVFPPLQSGAALAADNAACAALARAALGFGSDGGGGGGGGPGDLRVRDTRPWAMSARVAASYAPAHAAAGLPLNSSLLLAGDAAHEMPPAGGFGMNTGLQDAAGLAPKLAAVLGGDGRPSLVTAAYDAERRPVAVALTSLSLTNWRAALAVPRAVGADDRAAAALASLAAGAARLAGTGPAAAALEAGLAAGRALTTSLGGQAGAAWRAGRARAALAAPGAGLRLLFEGADLGYRYGPGAGGGQCALAGAAPGRSNAPPGPPFTDPAVYTPALVPGARFPAAAVRAVGGGRTGGSGGITSTIDLPAALASAAAVSASPSPSSRRRPLAVLVVDAGVAGPAATAAWVAAGEALASSGAPLATAVLGGEEAQAGVPPAAAALLLADDPAAPASATWAAVAGRSPTRPPALLVRPDGVVGWVAGEKGEAASAAAVAGGLAAVFGWGGGGGGGGYRPAWLRAV